MFFRRNAESELESRLRADRPEPDSGLIHTVIARLERTSEARRPRSLRLAFAVASVGGLAALGALGGVGYAASSVQHAATAVKHVFVAKAPTREAKKSAPVEAAGAFVPSKTAAGDQYGGPPGPFLPPSVTPQQATLNFLQYLITANGDVQESLNCNALRGLAKTACQARLKLLTAQQKSLSQRLNAAFAKIGTLSSDKQAAVARLLAIHLQQQAKLAAGQAARRANCAKPAYATAHRLICAKANPKTEAAERLRLGMLELQELEAFLAAA